MPSTQSRDDTGRRGSKRFQPASSRGEQTQLAEAAGLWALDVTGPCPVARPPRHALDVALQSVALLGMARTRAELACPVPGVTIRRLGLACRSDPWFSDLSATPELIADGAHAARAFLHAGAPTHADLTA